MKHLSPHKLAFKLSHGLIGSFVLLPVICLMGQPAAPEIRYPALSLPAIKLGDPLPEDLVPTHTGGAVPDQTYRSVGTFAGSGSAGGNNASGTVATFNGPWGISRDAQGNFYVADFSGKRIRKVTPAGVVSLIDEFGSFEPIATAIDPATGHLYVAISSHRILRYVNKNATDYPAQEPVYGPETNFPDATIIYIGTSISGTTDASGTSARLNAPHALAVRDGFLYVADRGNNRVRKVNLSNAAVETVTFTGGSLDGPEGIFVAPSGTIYVANTGGNDLIQKIQDGVISTYAGSGSGYANGMAAFAKFDNPRGLAMDAEGNLFVAEGNNNAIRRISPDGWVTPIAGDTVGGYEASKGYQDNIGDSARFNSPRGIVLTPDGQLYVTDQTNQRIRRLSLTGYEIEPSLPAGLALNPATGVISGTATELTPEGGELFPHYVNNFQNGLGSATLHGTAALSIYKKIQLTSNATNQSGGITIPAGNLNVQEIEVSFVLETTKASGGGQGLSYNFGEGVSGGAPSWILAESGIGAGLSLVFDPYGDTGNGVKGVRLLYGTKYLQSGITPGLSRLLAYSPSVAWAGQAAAIKLSIDALSRASLTIDGQAVFTNIPLPSAYTTADKSKWTHAILARTDATASDSFTIDDVSIRQSLVGAAGYRVTARNSMGSSVATVRINIKEAPAITFNLQSVLEEDAETGFYTPTGRDWETLPAVASGTEVVSEIAGDANARKLLAIKTNPNSPLHQRTLHIFNPDGGTWSRVDASPGVPLYGFWNAVGSSADGSVLVAVGNAESSTNSYGSGTGNLDITGKLALSTDGGTTWQTRPVGPSGAWTGNDVALSADGNTIYVAAIQYTSTFTASNYAPGALFVSRDRGATWAALYPAGSPFPVMRVSCDASATVVAINAVGSTGSVNRLLISTNGGGTWADQTNPNWTVNSGSVFKVSADGESIYGKEWSAGKLLASNDLGLTWRDTYLQSNPGGSGAASNCYEFAVSANGMRVAQETGGIFMVMSDDGVQTVVNYRKPVEMGSHRLERLITSHSGRRLVAAHPNGVYVSQGGGLDLTHPKGDSQVISVSLAAPDGFFRVTALEGVTVQGNGSSNLVVTGPLGLLNQILESLTYQGGADFTGAAGFTVTASASGVSNTQTNELTIQDSAQPEMAVQATSSAITETSAILGGTVLGHGGSVLTSRGVVISPTSANPSPVRGGNDVIDLATGGTDLGAFTVNATGLARATTYSFRAYAVNANGPQYSSPGVFTTVGGPPSIDSLSPSSLAVGLQMRTILVTGSNFQPGAQVAFSGGGIHVTSVTVDSSVQLTIVADIDPAATTGKRDVTVIQPDGVSVTRAEALTLSARPSLVAVNPNRIGQGGSKSVTLTGSGFASETTLACETEGITVRNIEWISSSEITADVIVNQAVAVGGHTFTLNNSDGGSDTLAGALQVTAGPGILTVSPSRRLIGAQDQTITVSGSNFDPGLTLRFSGQGITVESYTVNAETSISLVIDIAIQAQAGGQALTLTNPDGGTCTLENAMTLFPPPTLTAVTPATRGQGALDQSLLLTGTGFQDDSQVDLGDGITVKQVVRHSDTQLTAVVDVAQDATLGARAVTITNPEGGAATVEPVVLDPGFIAEGAGADGAIYSLCQTPEGKIVIAGAFSHVGGTRRGHIARINNDGSLDGSFDPGSGFNGHVAEIALQPDGRIIAAGAFSSLDGSPCGPIVRLNADGSIDPAFTAPLSLAGTQVSRVALQTDGKLMVAGQTGLLRLLANGSTDGGFTPANVQGTVLALQPDGKILVGGTGFFGRYSAAGVAESVFPLDGLTCTALTVQPDGKILFGGASGESGALIRLNPDLTFDSTFSAGQLGSLPITALARLSDGKVLAGAALGNSAAIFRVGSNGTWDTTFAAANGGFIPLDGVASTLLSQEDGKVLAAGMFTGGVTRVTADGALDARQISSLFTVNAAPSIDSLDVSRIGQAAQNKTLILRGNGFAGNPSASFSTPGITVQSCGLLSSTEIELTVSVGVNADLGVSDLILVNGDGGRVLLSDALEITARPIIAAFTPGFCGQGKSDLLMMISGTDFQTGATLAFSGYGVSVQSVQVISPTSISAVVNLATDADLDSHSLTLTNPDGGTSVAASAFTVTAGPRIASVSPSITGANIIGKEFIITGSGFSAGSAVTISGPGVSVRGTTVESSTRLRFTADLSPEATPGDRSVTITNTDGGIYSQTTVPDNVGWVPGPGKAVDQNSIHEIVVQPSDGRILVGGFMRKIHGRAGDGIARLLPNGQVDTSFVAGVTGNPIPNEFGGSVQKIRLLSDGKILIAGNFYSVNGVTRHRIARLFADGSLDTTFDAGTRFQYNTNAALMVTALAVQSDGKILIATDYSYNGQRAELARLNADGTPDSGFSPVITASWPGYSASPCVKVIQPLSDGKLLIAGILTSANQFASKGIARLNADGSTDTGFTISSMAFTTGYGTGYGIPDVKALVVNPADGSMVVGGVFTEFGGSPARHIVKLSANGVRDNAYASPIPAPPVGNADRGATKVIPWKNGGVLVSVNLVPAKVFSLRADGTLDAAFNFVPGTSNTPSSIYALARQADGSVLLGGENIFFTAAAEAFSPYLFPSIGRMYEDGRMDVPTTLGIFAITPQPIPTSLDVTTVVRGTTGQTIVVTGTGIQPGVVAEFAGSGVTVRSCTVNSATQVALVLDVADGASLGGRSLTLTNPDGGRASLGAALAITGGGSLSPFESWRLQHFGSAENAGDGANIATPNGDGVANLIKYALGLTPGQNSHPLLPRPSIFAQDGQRFLSIRFQRIPERNDVTIIVEVNSELDGSWTELARSTRGAAIQGSGGIAETPNSDGTVDCEVRDTVEIDQAAKRFMRVRVIAE